MNPSIYMKTPVGEEDWFPYRGRSFSSTQFEVQNDPQPFLSSIAHSIVNNAHTESKSTSSYLVMSLAAHF